MKHLKPLNKKARRIDDQVAAMREDVFAMQQGPAQQRPHVPMGCSLAFSPGWEVDSAGGTAGLCQPVERDIYDCYVTCFWPRIRTRSSYSMRRKVRSSSASRLPRACR